MSKAVAKGKYRQLVSDISEIYEGARSVLVEAYWRIGQCVVEVEQDGEVRAEYGEGLLKMLSDELSEKFGQGFSVSNLKNMRAFYLTHPKRQTSGVLDWSQYVALLPVEDAAERQRLEERAEEENLSSRELIRLVRELAGEDQDEGSAPAVKSFKPLQRPTNLALATVKRSAAPGVNVPEGKVLLDLGFYVHLAVPEKSLSTVTVTAKPFYTYAAVVDRVVDGDTLLVVIDLGFGAAVSERLRLRGINAPELPTSEGAAAREFLAGLLPPGKGLVIRSHSTDIYGRFVADVLFLPDGGTPEEALSRGVFLNQEILDAGHAVRMT